MAVTESPTPKTDAVPSPWDGFRAGLWQTEINVRDFIQQNYEPYEGDEAFLKPATDADQGIWNRLKELFVEERRKSVLDVSQIPSSITAHAPGYIDREHEVIVGLQTDAPLKRAIMPNGGFRLVVTALKTYGYEPDPNVVEAFTKYRKTHNDAVFDAYTADVRRCRSSHILTGLPDAYGRGRIIGDYRRVALYGVARLIKRKQEEKRELDALQSLGRGDPRPRGARRTGARAQGTAADGGRLRLRHFRSGADRHRSGPVAVLRLSRRASRNRTAPRCRSGGPRPSSTSISRGTWLPACSPRSRRRRSSTTSSSSCASSGSFARPSTTSCLPAIPPG